MSSSDDSFGWSTASDDTMSSGEEENLSQGSSVQERKSHKKQLRENLIKNQHGSESHTEFHISKKKKKKIREVNNEIIKGENGDISEQEIMHENIKSEPQQSTREKSKKKIKSEQVEQQSNEAPESEEKVKKKKKCKSELQETEDVQESIIEQDDRDGTSKKKKKRKRDEEGADNDVLDESSAIPPAPKKRKKHIASSDTPDILDVGKDRSKYQHENSTLHDSTASDQYGSSKNRKKNISLVEDTNTERKREKARELIRKESVHFDDSENVDDDSGRKYKESISSSSTKSRRHKNSTNSTASYQRKNSIASEYSTERKNSSSSIASRIREISVSSASDSKPRHSSSKSLNHSRKRSSSSSRDHSKPSTSKTPDKVVSSSESGSDAEPDKHTKYPPATPVNKFKETRKRSSFSDKIRFEDDIDLEENVDKNSQSPKETEMSGSSSLEKFINKNPQLKPVRSAGSDETIDSDDEVWLLKCPKDYDDQMLKDMDISIDSKTKIKLGGQTFDGTLEEETHRIAVLFPSIEKNKFEIRDIRPKGILAFRKRIPKVHISDTSINAPRQMFIPLPETKRRHPLFGHDYRKFIKIPKTVAERLNETEPRKKLKSSRKHKLEKHLENHVSKEEPEFLTQEEVLIKKKKKRKRKLSETGSAETIVKKFKHDPDSAIVWDSEKAIEKSLFNF